MTQAGHTGEFDTRVVVHVCSIGIVPRLFLVEHFKRLREAGYEVILACFDDADARHVASAAGICHVPIVIKQGVAPFSGLRGMLQLLRLLRRKRPAIVDSHGSKAGIVGSIVSWLTRTPIRIYHNHGMALLSARGLKRTMFRLVETLACKMATRVIYVAASNMEDAIAAGVCPRGKATVLGPGTISGIDVTRFDPRIHATRGTELREAAGLPRSAIIVGFVGRIVPHKGVATILEAWRQLPAAVRQNSWLCMFGALGTAKMYALVEAAVSQPELHVKYMGFSDEMPAWYAAMGFLVQPSWHEGWGYNVLEAACSGVPAIGTRISATIDAIVENRTGLLVPVKDADAMAAAITRLIRDASLRESLGRAARERAVGAFSQEQICPLLLIEYGRLLDELGGGVAARDTRSCGGADVV